MPESPIVVRGVARSFASTVALDDVSFEVRAGEMFGLIGPDGAGKTTLLRIVCGLDRPGRGSVSIFGVDPRRKRRVVTGAIGYVSQQFSLYGDLTIDENIAFFARLHGVVDYTARRDRLLALTGLTPFRTRLADRLSGGMKQKLALSCTLVHEPPLLVLDEPTTGVDPVSRREFWKLLAEFVAGGLTIVLATPYLDEAERCHRVALLSEGRLLALDEPNRLRRALPGQTLEVQAADPRRLRELLERTPGILAAESYGDRLHVRLAPPLDEARLRSAAASAGIADVRVRSIAASLEDVFIELLAGTDRDRRSAEPRGSL